MDGKMDSGMCENGCYDMMKTSRFADQNAADTFLRECMSKCSEKQMTGGNDWNNGTSGPSDGNWDGKNTSTGGNWEDGKDTSSGN